MESVFLTGSNLLYLSSYIVRDILWLRILTILAIGLLMPFYGLHQHWDAVAWEGVFMLINIYQTAVLLHDRRPVRLSDQDKELRDLAFPRLAAHEFRSLMSIAEWKECQAGEALIEQGAVFSRLMILHQGRLVVETGGETLAELGPGRFIGEMSFITGEATTADVRAAEPARYVSWSSDKLETLFKKQPDLRTAVQLLIANDLAAKLVRGGQQLLVKTEFRTMDWSSPLSPGHSVASIAKT